MLNPSQKRAVEHFGKPLLIVAGAGSGKTKTLTHKVAHLISKRGIKPERILAITFTNKAGEELKRRIKKLTGLDLPNVGTFHSFTLGVLKRDYNLVGYKTLPIVLDEDDRSRAIKNLVRSKGFDIKVSEKLKGYLSSKMEGLSEYTEETFENLMEEYLNLLRENGYVDFSSMLFYALEILKIKPYWKGSFDFVLIDEFQDTNSVQYEIVKTLAKENVCVVGDPNQCIYEWRYAKPHNMLKFKEDFSPDVIKLEENYRSTKAIIAFANSILENSRAEWKHLVPILKTEKEEGDKPFVIRFENEEKESQWISHKIRELSKIYKFSDIAILVRVGYVTNPIERAFNYLGIPYTILGQVRFFERAEIKDALSFLKILVNPQDGLAFERAIKCVKAGAGRESLKIIKDLGENNYLNGSLKAINLGKLREGISRNIYEFLRKLSNLKNDIQDYPRGFKGFLDSINFWDYLMEEYEKDYEERKENVKELLRYMESKHKEGYSVHNLISEISISVDKEEEKDGVRIMTIHASKGLEFPVIFLPRLEDGILPHEKRSHGDEIEEELRLFYVAVTRAKEKLYISYTKSKESKPSKFLSWVPKNLMDLSAFKVERTSYMPKLGSLEKVSVGDRVFHRVFGEGVVVSVIGEKADVVFGDVKKTIYTSFLEIINK